MQQEYKSGSRQWKECLLLAAPVLLEAIWSIVYSLRDEFCTVKDSISWICERLKVNPTLKFTGGDRGWVGDNPSIFLDTTKVRKTGWRPELTIRQSVERTVDWLGAGRQQVGV